MITSVGVLVATLIILYRWIGKARAGYVNEKDVTQAIVTTFHDRLQKQGEKTDLIAQEAQATRTSVEKIEVQVSKQSEKIDSLVTGVETSLIAARTVAKHMITVREQTNKLIGAQKTMQDQINLLDNRYQGLLPETEALAVSPTSVAHLTATEMRVLEILIQDGSKPAPELQKIIGKSREHTARLMKKLSDAGYVEREGSKIPYTYSISEKARAPVEEMMKKLPLTEVPVKEGLAESPEETAASLAKKFQRELRKHLTK
ncbi:MAG TPA: MarR family winged helix-turn-helix transcriptional regulator [archaeon]|nr:MarR family winged helix-turn-helix transcriptional regulator [archaeon]